MTNETSVTGTDDGGSERWWQWHLGDRMAAHQHPDEELGCRWPECAWHGVRPGDDNLIDSLPESALRSVALSHLDGVELGEGARFVYERDVAEEEDDDELELDW